MLCVFCTSFKGFDRRRAAARWASKFSSPPPPEQTCREPCSLTPEFSMSFLLINIGWGRAIAGTNFDFSTGRLADGKKCRRNFDLSTERNSELDLPHSAGAEVVARGCMLLCNHN